MHNTQESAFRFQSRFSIAERFKLDNPQAFESQVPGKRWEKFRKLFSWPWF